MIRVRPRLVTWAQHLHSAASQWSSAEAQTQLFCHRVLQGPLVEKLPVNSSIAAANVGFTSLVTPQLPDWLVDIRQYPRKTPTANLLDAELQSLSPSASAFVASTHEPDSPSVAVENSHSWPRAASRGYSIRPGGLCWAAATTFTTTTINHTPTPNTFTSPLQRAFSSDPSPSSDDAESPHKVASSDEGAHEKLVLYRGRWIKPLRLLVRWAGKCWGAGPL